MHLKVKKYLHELGQAIKYYFEAKTIYNVHSPLLFDFFKSLKKTDSSLFEQSKKVEGRRKVLLRDNSLIEFSDLGMGSRRKISTIKDRVIHSSSGIYKCQLLFSLSNYFKPDSILEFGTNLGFGTAYLHIGNPDARIRTVEGSEVLRKIALQNFSYWDFEVESIRSSFEEYIENNKDGLRTNEMVFLDGNHSFDGTLTYFEAIYNPDLEKQIIIVDDIHWSEEMTKVWNALPSKLNSGFVIDLFKIGIIIHLKDKKNVESFSYIDWKFKPFSLGLRG